MGHTVCPGGDDRVQVVAPPAEMNAVNATVRFTIDPSADPPVFAYQAARLALVHHVAARVSGLKVDQPLPTLLLVTGAEQPMAELLAALEKAQAYSPLVLDVDAADEQGVQDFAEFLRDRSDTTVIVARQAQSGPAS